MTDPPQGPRCHVGEHSRSSRFAVEISRNARHPNRRPCFTWLIALGNQFAKSDRPCLCLPPPLRFPSDDVVPGFRNGEQI